MNQLEQIISGATDDGVSTSNLLRKMKVVAHYLKATEVTEWVENELDGYPDIDSLPKYRKNLMTPVMGTWTGYFQRSATQLLSPVGLPEDAAEVLFNTNLNQSITELEELAALPKDPAHAWDPWHVVQFNALISEGKGVSMVEMQLLDAHRVVTRASIRGIINTVRNTALDLALHLHSAAPDAGTVTGPTVADAPIATTLNHFTTNVYGHGANLAFGNNANQRSKVVVNDVDSLVAAARAAGLDEDGLTELRAAAEAPGEARSSKFKALLQKVKTGTLVMGTEVSGEVAASQIDQLIQLFLGQS